jgi:hypothetical protein
MNENEIDELISKRIQLDDHKDKDKDKDRDKDKDKYVYHDLGNIVKTPQADQDRILTGIKYKATFSKKVISFTPASNESGLIMCNKWHIGGEKCDQRLSHKQCESAPHKSAYDKWVKGFKAKNPWQSGPTEVIGVASNFSPAKINYSSYMYLGCADSDTYSRNYDCSINHLVIPSLSMRVHKPIASLPTSSTNFQKRLTTGKPQDTDYTMLCSTSFNLDNILPEPQTSPVKHSGKYS